ncbi:MAG TPA: hypothetical protein VFB12_03845, partial [Ktedonobacteraceae bacterium]|nr:hypothetical protein [Ktedonobacteraceae bacterium]
PRLLAAGADPTQISLLPTVEDLDSACADIIDRPFSIAHDLDLLSRAIRQLNPALVILDTQEPFSSAHYRDHLPKLNRLAELAGCAILLIRAISRPPTLSTMRNLTACGTSPALLHLVRSVLRLIPSFDDDSCYLISTKHALTAQPLDLPFFISSAPASSFIPALSSPTSASTPDVAQLSPEDLACFYAPSLPIICWLPPNIDWPPPQGANALPAVPASLSAIRQDILACLEASPRILSIPEIVEQIDHGYDAVRRALSRMRIAREVVSPSRGLYTTPEHPCLATSSKSSSPHKHHSSQPSQPSQLPQPSGPIQSSSSTDDLISPSPTSQSTPATQEISIDIAPQPQQRQPFESVQPSQPSQSIELSRPPEAVQPSQSSQSQHPSRQDESQLFESIQPSQSSQPDSTISGDSSHEPPSPDSTSSAP